MSMISTSPSGPVSASERVEVLDVLRGFALFGILLVNMYDYLGDPLNPLGRVTHQLVVFFAEDNFYPLFSLLFGAGFAIQMLRAKERGASGTRTFVRRILILLLFAALFWVFLEDRNVLLRYAFLAFPLLLFRRASPRLLLISAALCVGLAAHAPTIGQGITQLRTSRLAPEQLDERRAQAQKERAESRAAWQRASESGTYMDFVRLRAAGLTRQVEGIALGFHFTLPHIFALFLLGVYAIRRGILQEPERHLGLLRRVVWVGALIGIVGELVAVVPFARLGITGPLPGRPFRILELSGWIALALCYGAGLVLLLQRAQWKRRLSWFAPAGRMALTNYMLHSVFLTHIFLPFGLGFQEKAGPLVGALLTVVLFGMQVSLSQWWLARYRFGPAEWLWRSLTYGRLQPMRLRQGVPVPSLT